MRFSRHLSSHLTPEWRKKYIQYGELKKMLYEMVGSKKTLLGSWPQNREELHTEEVAVDVDLSLQDEFFKTVEAQLQSIAQFFRKEEFDLQCSVSELQEKVVQMGMMNSRQASKQRRILKRALSETYLNLILLQNFQQLNHTGFRKILKKHDKLAQSSRGKTIFQTAVCRSYFWTSKNVTAMMEEVERSMIQLEDGNRTKAMNRLRVPPLGTEHRRSHWTSYFAGLFSGLLLLSIVVVCIAFSQWPAGDYLHLEPSLRAMRAGLVLCIWFYGFAVNTFGWRRAGVNNVLIFEFDPRNYLNFVELFAVAGMVSVIWMVGLYLIAFAPWLHIPVYVGPLVMYGLLVSVLILPLPVLRPRSRLWLLKRLGRIACAPFFYVTFADFWIADQLTSLSLAMLDTEYFFCYLFYGKDDPGGGTFSCGTGTYGLRVVVAVLPAWWRLAQCMRRYYDTRQVNPHLINAGKYSTSFFVVVFSAVASTVIDGSLPFLDQSLLYLTIFGLWVLSAIVSTSYTFSWDILMDWSLFPNIPAHCCRKDSLTLRDERIYTYKLYYVLALVENFLFRTLWIFNLSIGHHVLRLLSNDIIATIAGVLEIVRRFIWNFFRVENEHVNNVGQFRAVRDLSLYPVDLSGQAEQEDNEDFLERRGSLEKGEALPGKKKMTRRLSNDLIEVTDSTGTRVPRKRKGMRKRKRTISATLAVELQQIAVDEDTSRRSPLLGYNPGNQPQADTFQTFHDSDTSSSPTSPLAFNLIYSSSPNYRVSALQDDTDFALEDTRNKHTHHVFPPDNDITVDVFPSQPSVAVTQVELTSPQSCGSSAAHQTPLQERGLIPEQAASATEPCPSWDVSSLPQDGRLSQDHLPAIGTDSDPHEVVTGPQQYGQSSIPLVGCVRPQSTPEIDSSSIGQVNPPGTQMKSRSTTTEAEGTQPGSSPCTPSSPSVQHTSGSNTAQYMSGSNTAPGQDEPRPLQEPSTMLEKDD